MPADHPLRSQRVWTSGVLDRQAPKVYTGRMQNQTTGLSATGVPPHLALANELATLKKIFAATQAELGELFAALPAKVTTAVLAQCEVNGAVPIPLTAARVTELMATPAEHAVGQN